MLGAESLGGSEVCPKLNFGALAGVVSGALAASWVWPKLNFGVLEPDGACRLANGLLAGVCEDGLAPPNMFEAAAGSAGFDAAAAPKSNKPVEGVAVAGAGVASLFCDSDAAPKPPNAGAAAGVCAAPPKLKMLEAGAGVLVLGGAAGLVAPNWKEEVLELVGAAEVVAPNWNDGVLGAAGVDVFAPKLKVGCEAGAGVLGAAAADELAPPKLKAGVDAPLVVPNMLDDPDELLVLFC